MLRFGHVASDVLVSMNTPMRISERSAAAEHAGAGAGTMHTLAPQLFKAVLSSFVVQDWRLFG